MHGPYQRYHDILLASIIGLLLYPAYYWGFLLVKWSNEGRVISTADNGRTVSWALGVAVVVVIQVVASRYIPWMVLSRRYMFGLALGLFIVGVAHWYVHWVNGTLMGVPFIAAVVYMVVGGVHVYYGVRRI